MKSLLRAARSWALRPATQQLDLVSEQSTKTERDARAQRGLLEDAVRGAASNYLDQIELVLDQQQYDFEVTLRKISAERMSFARFGDGEFKSMLRPSYNLRFQPGSPALANELRSVFTGASETPSCLIGFPTLYRDLHWSRVWIDIWPEVRSLITPAHQFGNAHVSRPIVFQKLGQKAVELWRAVWSDRDVVLITGENSRMHLIPELFDCVQSVERVDSLAVDAFSDIDRVMGEVARRTGRNKLFLIALGPAGTILASKIAALGEQAVDIGHISDSYETVFQGGAWPEHKPLNRVAK